MTENNIYALNQVSKSNIAPENLEVRRAKNRVYTEHFRQEITATVSRAKYQSKQWHCGFADDSSMDAHHTRGNNNRPNRYSIPMQKPSEWRFNYFKR